MTVSGRVEIARGVAVRLLVRLAWVVIALLLAFGAAGLVTGVERTPGTPARGELTWAADLAIEPGLRAARTDLQRLADDVDALGLLGRQALAAMAARNPEAMTDTLADGSLLIAVIGEDIATMRARLGELPGIGPTDELVLSAGVRERYEILVSSIELTSRLPTDWARLTSGSAAAIRLLTLLDDHDRHTASGARSGRAGQYAEALESLERSKATISEARELRDVIANASDVSVLDEWLTRNATYDDALAALYRALQSSRGQVTAAVRRALDAEEAAKARLPPDTRGLVVIMGEVARGGMNQAVIGIEEAKGGLDAALTALDQPTPIEEPEAEPSPVP
jgi:hypothetical protein